VTGHELIINIRKAYKRPKAVWLWVGINHLSETALWANYEDLWAHPWVDISPKDRIELLDLRFLVGLQVHIDGNDSRDRILKTHRYVSLAGAEMVFTMVEGNLIFNPGKRHEFARAG